jgi:hypothetical protein
MDSEQTKEIKILGESYIDNSQYAFADMLEEVPSS